MPKCSVIIATHQRLSMLKQALRSALAQHDVDLEVIVVENGSTDGTASYLKSITDPRVVPVIFQEALGGLGARNAGLRMATGDWIGFLDDDDLWAPDKLRVQLDAAEAAGCDWVYTGCVYIDGNCDLLGGSPPPHLQEVVDRIPLRYSIPGGLSSILWRSGVLDHGGQLETRLAYMLDWDLSLRLLRHGLPAAVPRPLVAFRQHGANMSVRARSFISELAVIDEKFADLRGGRRLDVAYQYRHAGTESLRVGERREAFESYLKAVRLGDWGALVRSLALPLPASFRQTLRRTLLSNKAWMSEADRWLRELCELQG